MEKGALIIKNYQKLVSERAPLDNTWYQCFAMSYPYRGQGFLNRDVDGITQAQTAKKVAGDLYDSTATDSLRLLASSVLSSITPSNQQWLSFAIAGVNDDLVPHDGKKWLEAAAETMYKNIHASNYDAQALEFFTDEMAGGMLGLYIEKKEGNYHFEVWPLATLYCQEVLGDGYIDTIYRQVKFTPAEAYKKFGTRVPEAVKTEYETDPYSNKQFDFIHTIRPRFDKKGKQMRGKIKSSLPFESVYVCKKSGMVCLESGYHEMPVVVPRWMRIPDTDYAFGPMIDALPDMRTLNKVTETMIKNAEMAISGTFVAVNDGTINPATFRIGPNRIVYVNDINNIKPLASGGDIQFAVGEIGRLQGQVRRTLLADQLGPTEKAIATATEINTRTSIIRQILGPIFGRLQAEYLVPLVNRCFGLGERDGDFGQPPDSIAGSRFNITYRSPLALAQKQQQLQAIQQFELGLSQTMQIKPEVGDAFDWDKATQLKAELGGVPIDLMRDEATIIQFRKKKAAEQAQASVQAAGQEVAANGIPPELASMLGGEAA